MLDITNGFFAAHWGLTDLYKESSDKLCAALESGEDFDTGWWGCSKEIHSCRISREYGHITVEVSCSMDDLWEEPDLIYDALWDSCRFEGELPDDVIESIREDAVSTGIDDWSTASAEIPSDSTLEDVISVIGKLESEASGKNDEMFARLCDIVKDYSADCKN